MNQKEIDKLVNLRHNLIEKFTRLRDYKNNKNAIIKEIEYAKSLHEIIVSLDLVLKDHVSFSDKK